MKKFATESNITSIEYRYIEVVSTKAFQLQLTL